MDYNFNEIEPKWQNYWRENGVYKVTNDTSKKHYYVLDMFPYPREPVFTSDILSDT